MGKLDVVYLDRGTSDGVEPGHVFSIFRDGTEIVIDGNGQPVKPEDRSTYEDMLSAISSDNAVKMPDIYHGKVMVFKVFDKVSLGLILINEKPVRVHDKLLQPDRLLQGE